MDDLYLKVKRAAVETRSPVAAKDWFDLLLPEYTQSRDYSLVVDFRRTMVDLLQRDISPEAIGELYHKSLIMTAPDKFVDYLLAVEWKRQPKAKFWTQRSKVLEGQHHLVTKLQNFIDDPEARYFGLSLPPGTGKSTLIKFLLSWIYGCWPNSANMYVSYAAGMVRMIYDSVTSIILDENEYDFKTIFPQSLTPNTSAELYTISARSGGDFPTIGLVSLGGSVTGRTRANKFLITDDLVKDAEEARSPTRLQKLWEDYTSTITTRSIGDDVKQIQLGTIWSVHDPISRNLERYKGRTGYTFIAIPVCDESGESNFYFDHPDRYSKEKIEEIRESMPEADFECLYMQHGIEKSGLAFPASSLSYYNGVLPVGEARVVFANDVAWGGGDRLCMPIGYVYGQLEGGFWDVYIHDVLYTTKDKSITKPLVAGKILLHKVSGGRTEANNGGDEFNDDVSRILREKHNYSCAMESATSPGRSTKIARIEQYSADIVRFHFRDKKHRSEEYEWFMRELTSFSFTSVNKHDDAPDGLAILAAYLRRPRLATISTGPRPDARQELPSAAPVPVS